MKAMSVIDWLLAYRRSSPIYVGDNLPFLSTPMLGKAIRLQCASEAAAIDGEDDLISSSLDMLAACFAIAAFNSGRRSAILDIGGNWSVLIRRIDGPTEPNEATLPFESRPVDAGADISTRAAPSAVDLCEAWDAALPYPFMLERSDEEIGEIAQNVVHALRDKVDIDTLTSAACLTVLVTLHLQDTDVDCLSHPIYNLSENGVALGSWGLFVSRTGNFDAMIAQMATDYSSRR